MTKIVDTAPISKNLHTDLENFYRSKQYKSMIPHTYRCPIIISPWRSPL